MSELILIRHGQASFLKQDYDQLSALGQQQMHALGDYLGQRAFQPTHVFFGPKQRHQQSLDALYQGLLTQQQTWPSPILEEGLNEYPAFKVLAKALPALAVEEQDIADLLKTWQDRGPDAGRSFQKILETVTRRWVRGTLRIPGIPSWNDFLQQVHAGLHNITHEAPSGSTIVAVTSAGTIAAIAGKASNYKRKSSRTQLEPPQRLLHTHPLLFSTHVPVHIQPKHTSPLKTSPIDEQKPSPYADLLFMHKCVRCDSVGPPTGTIHTSAKPPLTPSLPQRHTA